MHSGEAWRLLSAIFVHLTLLHYLGNVFATFFLVTRVEYTYGTARTLLIFLVSGIGGNIFVLAVDSADYETSIRGGASTALFGMIGLILGYIVINWRGLGLVGETLRCQVICTYFFLLVIVLFFSSITGSDLEVDHLGHLGGFLTGLWLSSLGNTIVSGSREVTLRALFAVLLVGQLVGPFLGFYLSH